MQEKPSPYKSQMIKHTTDLVNSILAHNCGGGSTYGGKVRIKMTLANIIDYKMELNSKYHKKINLEEKKFKAYLTAVDGIVNDINGLFPFIDLTGIDLSWTGEEILNLVLNFMNKMPVYNLEQIQQVTGPRIIKEKRKKK